MKGEYQFLFLANIALATNIVKADNICHQYQLSIVARLDHEEPSYCDDSGLCHHLNISCNDAFDRLIDLQINITGIPPIARQISQSQITTIRSSDAMYYEIEMVDEDPNYFSFSQPPDRRFVDASMSDPDYGYISPRIDLITDRIISNFPQLVYDEQRDGELLRDVVSAAVRIGSNSIEVPGIELAVHQSDSMRKWAYCVRMMIDHISLSAFSPIEYQRILASFAPWMHAFLKSMFFMGIHFDNLLEDNSSLDIVHSIAKFHPKYTLDDGLWYIQYTEKWNTLRTPIQLDDSDIDYIYSLTNDMDEDIDAATSRPQQSPDNPLAALLTHQMDTFGDYAKIELAYHAVKYTRTCWMENICLSPTSEQIDYLNEFVSTNYYHALRSRFAISDIFGQFLEPHDLLNVLTPISVSNIHVRLRSGMHTKRMTVNLCNLAMSTIYSLSFLTKYDLAGMIGFDYVDNSGEDCETTSPPVDMYESLLEEIFHIRSGFFETDESGNVFRTNSAASLDQFLHPYDVSRNIGRVIGLAVKLRPLTAVSLTRFMSPVSPSRTVLESFFFNSTHIRSGFYDVYIDNMLETLFHNNGTRLFEALVHLTTTYV